jgi:hypothetical protein
MHQTNQGLRRTQVGLHATAETALTFSTRFQPQSGSQGQGAANSTALVHSGELLPHRREGSPHCPSIHIQHSGTSFRIGCSITSKMGLCRYAPIAAEGSRPWEAASSSPPALQGRWPPQGSRAAPAAAAATDALDCQVVWNRCGGRGRLPSPLRGNRLPAQPGATWVVSRCILNGLKRRAGQVTVR